MTAAQVRTSERDESQYIPLAEGLTCGTVVPDAVRGPVMKPVLVDSVDRLLTVFSIDGEIKANASTAYHGLQLYIARGGTAWVVRPKTTGMKIASLIIKATGSVEVTGALATALEFEEDPELSATDLLLITAKDPGAWGNRLKIKINVPVRKEFTGHFNVLVYLDDNLKESFKCTRYRARDGYRKSCYVVDVLAGSNYVSAIDNTTIASTEIPREVSTLTALTGGANGAAATSGDMIAAFHLYASPEDYKIKIFSDIGCEISEVQKALAVMAESRGSVALLGAPYSINTNSVTYVDDNLAYLEELLLNSSFASFYSPQVKIYDQYNDRELYIGPSILAAASIQFSEANYEIFYPPAGLTRGRINEALDIQRRFGPGDRDTLTDAGINTLRVYDGAGVVIWGQKTLSFPPSARDRLNVRLLINEIVPRVKTYLDGLLFDLNLPTTGPRVESLVDAMLLEYVNANGAYKAYSKYVATAEDIDNNKANIYLYIQPTKSLELIDEVVVIQRTGV